MTTHSYFPKEQIWTCGICQVAGALPNETPKTTAIRETKEELECEVQIQKHIGTYAKPWKNEVVYMYTGSIGNQEPQLSNEALEHGWLTIETIPKNTLRRHKQRIFDYLNETDIVTIREEQE